MSSRLIKLLSVSIAASLALSGQAGATTRETTSSVVVKYGDLDLGTKAGVATLHSRLHRAAQQVCGPVDIRQLDQREQFDQCVTDAVSAAVRTVGNSNLSLYHRYGRRAEIVASN